MQSREKLHSKLILLLGSNNVYYQPPAGKEMLYPCIRYSINEIDSKKANNLSYINTKGYNIIVISKSPDHEVIEKLLELPMSSFDRHYVSDNLNHDVIKLFF